MARDDHSMNLEYIKRINYALDFVENNLDSQLSLELLAGKAYYSPFHFHRIFTTIIGEPLNQYINRKRIERIAATLLVGTDKSIKMLAYEYGFNSESSFSRAFKKFYGINPSAFKTEGPKKLSKIGIGIPTMENYICDISNLKKWNDMKARITITKLDKIKLAGIRQLGRFERIGENFHILMQWGMKKKLLSQTGFKALTIYHDNPNVTQLSRVEFSTCVTVNQSIKADGEIKPVFINKGYFAVGLYEINTNEISKAWKSMCVWVMDQGLTFRDAEYFEEYLNDVQNEKEQKSKIAIYIPIENDAHTKVRKDVTYTWDENKQDTNATLLTYHQKIDMMKSLRLFYNKSYGGIYRLGKIYNGNADFSYFSITTQALKSLKLKFVIIFDHVSDRLAIALSGQNKKIRKKYWNIFKGSDWKKYPIVASIDDSLSIIEHELVTNPDFSKMEKLQRDIDLASATFIHEITSVLTFKGE